jgi:hypothetical protein
MAVAGEKLTGRHLAAERQVLGLLQTINLALGFDD